MKRLILASILTLLIAGCSSTINTVEPAHPAVHPNYINDRRIITDSELNDTATVKEVTSARVGGDLLKIQVKIMNETSSYTTLNYSFSWFDANGMEIPSPTSAWRTLMLEGLETKYISDVAPSPKAVDFNLKLLSDERDY